VECEEGDPLEAEVSMETMPSALWDGMIVPGGDEAVETLSRSGHALEFLKDQYRHCKTVLLIGAAGRLLAAAGIPDDAADPGLLLGADEDDSGATVAAFAGALARHRHFERETDPPRI
jgi:catalase